MASLIDRIPTQVPGLNHLTVVNEKILGPALGIVETAKSYVKTMRSDQKERQTRTIVLDSISRRDTSTSNPIDHEFTDSGSAQRQRVHELLNTRSLNAPFSDELPKRPNKQPINRWKIGFFSMLLVFAAAIIPLSIIAARNAVPDCDPDQPGRQSQATVTQTTTQISLLTFTTTRVTASWSTVTEVTVKTSLVTDVAKTTGLDTGPAPTTKKIVPPN